MDEGGYIRQTPERLAEIAASQTSTETDQIVESGEPVNLLVDSDTGEILAATYVRRASARGIAPMAIGSSCASGASYVMTNAGGTSPKHCFSGTGKKSVNVPGVVYASSGDYNKYFDIKFSDGWTSLLMHSSSVSYTKPRTLTSVDRGNL